MREDRATACRIIICDFRFRPAVGPCRRRLPARGSLPCARSLCGVLEPRIRWSTINLVGACAGHARPLSDASQAPTASPCYRRRLTKHLIATAIRFRRVAPNDGDGPRRAFPARKPSGRQGSDPGRSQINRRLLLCFADQALRDARPVGSAPHLASLEHSHRMKVKAQPMINSVGVASASTIVQKLSR